MDVLLRLTFFVIGVGLHVMLFRHGEWHLFAYKLKFIHIILIQLMIFLGVHLADPQDGWFQEVSTAFWLEVSLISGVSRAQLCTAPSFTVLLVMAFRDHSWHDFLSSTKPPSLA